MTRFHSWAYLALTLCLAGCSKPQVGTVLVYEIVRDSLGSASDPLKFVGVVERRVNPSGNKHGVVDLLSDGKIRVGVFGQDPTEVARVKRMLSYRGLLEFRILANSHDHAKMIEQARASDNREVIDPYRDEAHRLVGRWLHVDKENIDSLRSNTEVVSRADGPVGLEVLTVQDDTNFTGECIVSSQGTYDQNGQPCVMFSMSPRGAQLLAEITTANLPDQVRGFKRRLAIILDNVIMSAPTINSVIYDRGEITGHFTSAETEQLAAILASGPFPGPVMIVNEGKPTP
jgi:preprotein translocase subunit SecD